MNTNTHFLKNSLRFNALFSFLCALTILIFTVPISELMGEIPNYILISLAIGLLGFVLLILSISEKKIISIQQAKMITIMDLVWVIGSALLVSLGSHWFSNNGIVIILVVAAIVGLLAFFQYLGLKKGLA